MLNFIQNIDIFIIKQFYNFQHNLDSKLLTSILIFFTNLGNHGLIWIAVTLFLLSSKKYRKIGYLALISLIINAIIVNVILKNLTHRARPFEEISDIILLIKAPKDFSFPSGHTSASFTMVYVFYKHLKKYFPVVLITSIIIAFSRLYLTVHFPSDVLAGVLIGLFSGFWGEKILNRKNSWVESQNFLAFYIFIIDNSSIL